MNSREKGSLLLFIFGVGMLVIGTLAGNTPIAWGAAILIAIAAGLFILPK